MSTRKEHCEDCRRKLGKDWDVVHRWLDHFAAQTFPSHQHRLHRHHLAGIEEVRHRWGDEAVKAAEIHILADVRAYWLDHVPSLEEAETLWGQEIVHHPGGRIELKKRIPCD